MKFLFLSCSTGEGHNHCAKAVMEAFARHGHDVQFLDLLHIFDSADNEPFSFDKILNHICTKQPELFGKMYRAGAMYSSTGVTSPIYLANIRHAKELSEFIDANGYDAVICSHLFPMETLTYMKKHGQCRIKCYGVLTDYTCIPFLAETDLDGYFIPHEDVKAECVRAGIPAEKLIVSGMPVSPVFTEPMSKEDARAELGLPCGGNGENKLYLIMTGGIGCGDAAAMCKTLLRLPCETSTICVLAGRNDELREMIERDFSDDGVIAVPFTDKVHVYMHAADVLISKAGGISSSEAVVLGVPLVHTMCIPGVETLNAEFFESHRYSLFARTNEEAARFADRVVYDKKLTERMLEAQGSVIKNGGDRITEYVLADI